MTLPFTPEQFFDVFRAYNLAVWPAQVLLLALALGAVYLVVRPRDSSGPLVSALLAAIWLWLGAVYHLGFFAAINKLAYAFGALSIAAAALFFWHGVVRRSLKLRLSTQPIALLGVSLVFFALAVYPVWTLRSGHRFPAFPTFGLPCPTTMFTLGMLALLRPPYPRAPLVVPILWCAIGAQAAFLLRVPADLGLIAAAALGVALWVRAKRRAAPESSSRSLEPRPQPVDDAVNPTPSA